MSYRIKFRLNGCDISFNATAPSDITLEQLLRQCDKIEPDWCACGIKSDDFEDDEAEIIIDYDSVTKKKETPCKIRDNYNRTLDLIWKIYDTYTTGGALHIVLDDENVDDDSIYWCMENAIANNFENYYDEESWNDIEQDKEMFFECAENLLKMSEAERLKCILQAQQESNE